METIVEQPARGPAGQPAPGAPADLAAAAGTSPPPARRDTWRLAPPASSATTGSLGQFSSLSSSAGSMGELAAAPAAGPTGDAAAAAATAAAAAADLARKVVVLGVPWQTEDSTLEAHFSAYGAVEEAQIMRERGTGKSRGFGFVTFASAADARRAVGAEHLVDGRRCEAKFALPEGRVGSARTTRVFVARLPAALTDGEFRAYFEQFGAVQDAYMPKDPSKLGHRGIGFVTYASAEAVEAVMAQAHVLGGNEVAIDRATPKERGAPGGGGGGGGGLGGLGARGYASQPNLPLLAGGSGGGGGFFRPPPPPGGGAGGWPDDGGAGGLGARRMSHPALGGGFAGGASPEARRGAGAGGALGLGGFPSSGAELSLLAAQMHAQQAALQQHLAAAGGDALGAVAAQHAAQQQQLMSLIGAAAASGPGSAAGGPGFALAHAASFGALPGSAAASTDDLAALLAGGDARGWGASAARAPGAPGGGAPGGAGPFGPASARAGPRIFVGKLPRDAGEADVRDYFARFGYVLDVYLPRGGCPGRGRLVSGFEAPGRAFVLCTICILRGFFIARALCRASPAQPRPADRNNKREHRGFGFVTFETDAAIARVVQHGAHAIRGSLVAIDAAVPRQEEAGFGGGGGDGGGGAGGAPGGGADALQASLEALRLGGAGAGGSREGSARGGRHGAPPPGLDTGAY